MGQKDKSVKQSKYSEVLQRLNDNLVFQQSLGNGIAIENIKKLIKFFESK